MHQHNDRSIARTDIAIMHAQAIIERENPAVLVGVDKFKPVITDIRALEGEPSSGQYRDKSKQNHQKTAHTRFLPPG